MSKTVNFEDFLGTLSPEDKAEFIKQTKSTKAKPADKKSNIVIDDLNVQPKTTTAAVKADKVKKQKPVEQKPVEQKPVEQKPVEQKPVEQKQDVSVSQDKNSESKNGFVDNRNWFQKLCGHLVGMDDVYDGLSQVNTRLDSIEESGKKTQEKLDTIQTEQKKAADEQKKAVAEQKKAAAELKAEIRAQRKKEQAEFRALLEEFKAIALGTPSPKERTSKKKTS